jgi:hypothetical protein
MIVIDDQIIQTDLVVAVNISGYDFNNLLQRKVSFTSTIKIVKNENSLKLLGLPANYQSKGNVVYTKVRAKYIQDGVQLIDGFIFVKKVSNQIELNIFDAPISFLNELKNYNLYQLQYLTDSAYSVPEITNTTGVLKPVISWGGSGPDFLSPFDLPSFSYSEIINNIIDYLGYTKSGDIFDDPQFERLIIPYSRDRWEYPDELKKEWGFFVLKVSPNTAFTTATKISYQGMVSEGSFNPYNATNSMILIPTLGASGDFLEFELSASLRFEASGSVGNDFYFRLVLNRGMSETFLDEDLRTMTAPGLGGDVSLSATVELREGDEVYVKYYPNTGTPTITVPGGFGSFDGRHTGKVYDSFVFWNYLLPDLSFKDLFDDFIIRFALIIKEKNNELFFKSLQQIINDKHLAVDWTTKRAGEADINFVTNLTQINNFNYNDEVGNGLGKGFISVNNENLSLESDLVNSIFSNTDFRTLSITKRAYIPVFDVDATDRADFSGSPGLRLLYRRNRLTKESPFIPDANSQVAVFEHPSGETVGAGWGRFISRYYSAFELALNNYKEVTMFYNLDVNDMSGFDVHKLVFDNDAYYLVKQISNFVPNRPTKVIMLKVL